MMQTVGNDLQNSNVQDLTNKSASLTNTISATNLMSQFPATNSSMKNSNSISSSALLSNIMETKPPASDSNLTSQLEKNTADILALLKTRHELLTQLRSDSAKSQDLTIYDAESTNSKVLINNSIGLLNTMTINLIGSSDTSTISNSQHANSIQILIKLEEYLNKLNRNLNESSAKLPDLKSTMSSIAKKQPSIGSSLSRVSRDFSNHLIDSVADAVSTTTTSELTADLSEDEQINYYDEYDYDSSNDNLYDAEKFENSVTTAAASTADQQSMLRRFSDSSNKTLCVLSNGPSTGTANGQKNVNVDADDEEDDLLYRKKLAVNNEKFSRKNSIVNKIGASEYLESGSTKGKLTCSQSSSDLNETTNKRQSALKYSDTFDGGSEIRKSFRSSNEIFQSMSKEPKPLSSPLSSPSKTTNLTAIASSISQSESSKVMAKADDLNDSSDDEVKDYLTFKENFDEISHV